MSEETTKEQNGTRPFEERVLSMLTEMREDFNESRTDQAHAHAAGWVSLSRSRAGSGLPCSREGDKVCRD
jgi:hypothetical protein